MSDYTPTNKPINGSWNASKVLRDEFALIETALNSKADSYGASSVSTTTLTIADTLQTFTMEAGKEFIPGMNIYMGDAGAPSTNYMLGLLTSYDTVTGLSAASISSHVGSGTKSSWIIGLSNSNGATLVNNAFTGHQDFARATVASAATTADIWSALGNQIDFTGTATVTGFPAALQAGAERTLICAAACTFTAGTNMIIDGVASGSSVTCAANDKMIVRAITTTQFNLTRIRYDGYPQKLVGRHEVVVYGGNGHGATNTKIRRYSTTKVNTGTAITYADSAANGATFTFNDTGLYKVRIKDANSDGACNYGFSLNSAQLTTNVESITEADRKLLVPTSGSEIELGETEIIYAAAGDVGRVHTDGSPNLSTNNSICSILKVANA